MIVRHSAPTRGRFANIFQLRLVCKSSLVHFSQNLPKHQVIRHGVQLENGPPGFSHRPSFLLDYCLPHILNITLIGCHGQTPCSKQAFIFSQKTVKLLVSIQASDSSLLPSAFTSLLGSKHFFPTNTFFGLERTHLQFTYSTEICYVQFWYGCISDSKCPGTSSMKMEVLSARQIYPCLDEFGSGSFCQSGSSFYTQLPIYGRNMWIPGVREWQRAWYTMSPWMNRKTRMKRSRICVLAGRSYQSRWRTSYIFLYYYYSMRSQKIHGLPG